MRKQEIIDAGRSIHGELVNTEANVDLTMLSVMSLVEAMIAGSRTANSGIRKSQPAISKMIGALAGITEARGLIGEGHLELAEVRRTTPGIRDVHAFGDIGDCPGASDASLPASPPLRVVRA